MFNKLFILIAGLIFLSGYNGFMTSVSAADNPPVQSAESEMKRISPKDLNGLLERGEGVVIVDVRPTEDYKKQHIAGAITVPLELVETSLNILPPRTNIVFY
jgi:hypothetical protein